MKIIKNIFKNELYLLGLLVFAEALRALMGSGEYLSIGLKQFIIMVLAMAVFSVIQQVVRERHLKKGDSQKEIE